MSKDIINLTKVAFAKDTDARKARWELGNALLVTFFTKERNEWVRNTSIDKDARTVKDEAIANAKRVGKSAKALEVFYGEAIAFAKKHKTVQSAMNNTIKAKKKPATKKQATISATKRKMRSAWDKARTFEEFLELVQA